MKNIFKLTCLLTLIFSVSLLAETLVSPGQANTNDNGSSRSTCCNYGTTIVCSTLPPCVECGQSCGNTTTVCVEVEDPSGGDNYSIASYIDNFTFNYIHSSADVKLEKKGEGCSSCGSSAPSTTIPRVHLNRIHRFRNTTEQSSFGPGVFSSWDINLKLYKDGNGRNRIDFSDPSDLNTRKLFPQNGKFYDTFARAIGGVTLFKVDNSTTTDVDLAVRAELKTRDHRVFKFDVFEFEGAKAARLTEIVNRNGYSMIVTYEVAVDDSNADETEKWKMSTISDETGRVIAFTYLSEQRNSMWVIGSIQLPNGNVITYDYNPVQDASNPESDERLIAVNFPDGTQSTFTREVTDSGKTKVSFFEAGQEGFDRNKSVYLSSNIGAHRAMDGLDYFNSASLLIVYATKGQTDEEVAYYGKQYGHVMHRQIYEGEGKLKWTDIAAARFYDNWEFDEDDGFTGSREPTYNHGEWTFYAGNRQGSPPVMYDKKGIKTQLAYNSDNAKKRKTYPDGTFEAWEHNEFLQVTRHRDRLGRVTHYTYDERGNMLTKTVGLKAQSINNNNERINGLSYKLFVGVWNSLPNFGSLTPYDFGVISTPDLNEVNRSDKFAALYEGDIEITTGGVYKFWTGSDDGSKLYIDGNLVVDNDGLHGLREVESLEITLDPGLHTFRLEFFEKGGNQQLYVHYQGPDTYDSGSGVEEKVSIPQSVYTHLATGSQEEDVTTPETATYEWRFYPAGHAHEFLLKDEIDANGNVTTYTYNDDHLLEYIYEPDDDFQTSNNQHLSSAYSYDSAKRLRTTSDAVGRTTTYSYDSRDRLSQIQYSDLSTELYFYGTAVDANLLVKKKDRNGNTTKMEYDEQGRVETQIVAYSVMNDDGSTESVNTPELQSVSTYEYLNGTNVVKNMTVDGEFTEYFYDYRHRLVETRRHADNDSILTSKKSFHRNQLLFTEDPYGRRTYNSYRTGSDSTLIRTVQETVPGAVNASNFSQVNNLTRVLTNNAPYIITDFEKDVALQTTAIVDPRGIRHETDYDCRGRTTFQVRAADTLAQTTQTLYDANSNVIEVRNPRYFSESINDRTVMTYTGRNLLESRTVASGSLIEATESFTYYLDSRADTHTDFRGNTSKKVWKQCCGRLGVIAGPVYTNEDGDSRRSVQIMQYDFYGNVTHTAILDWDADTALPPCCYPNPLDANTLQEVTTKYDSRHRPIARTVWLSALDDVDPNDIPIATDPALGLTTTYQYFDDLSDSQLTDIVTELVADGISLGAPHADAAQGSAVITTNPEGEKSVAIMDGAGRTVASGMLSSVDGSLVSWNTVTHDNVVNSLLETTQTSALGFQNKVRTDGAGRRINTIDAEDNVSNFFYDANSNLVSYRDVNGVGQDCDFDDLNRDEECTDTEGDTISKDYDLNNNVVVMTDAKNNTKTCVYDVRNRKESCTDRINGVVSYTYDENNNLKTVTDQDLNVTAYDYDERNLQVKVTYPDHIAGQNAGDQNYGITECAYDAMGRKSLSIDQKGEKVEYFYDLASRLEDRVYLYADNTEESRDEFSYDLASRLLSASKGRYSNIISNTYDEIGRPKSETTTIPGSTGGSPASYTVTYNEYDADNRLTEVLYPAGNSIVKGYTDRNQLESVAFNAASIIASTYDDGGREETRTFGNSIVATNAFNLDNTLDSRTVSGSTGILPELGFSYGYDENKNVESETAGGVLANYSWSAGFDDKDRVTSWNRAGSAGSLPASQSWNLDHVGNWDSVTTDSFTETRDHNNIHELTGINSSSIEYDSKGNLLENSHGNDFVWDIDNHLVSVYTGSGNGGGIGNGNGNGQSSDLTTFTYDALGRRLTKQTGNEKKLFISSGHQVIEEYEAQASQSFNLARSYVYGSYVDDVLAKVEANNTPTVLYYHSDRQFNVRGLTDAAGNVRELYSYTPYGKQIILDESGVEKLNSEYSNFYGYTGRYLDSKTGLWYFRARYFDNEMGRFISRDPLGYIDGYSLYSGYFSWGFGADPLGLFDLNVTLAYDQYNAELVVSKDINGVLNYNQRKSFLKNLFQVKFLHHEIPNSGNPVNGLHLLEDSYHESSFEIKGRESESISGFITLWKKPGQEATLDNLVDNELGGKQPHCIECHMVKYSVSTTLLGSDFFLQLLDLVNAGVKGDKVGGNVAKAVYKKLIAKFIKGYQTDQKLSIKHTSIICADGKAAYYTMGLPDFVAGKEGNDGIAYGVRSSNLSDTLSNKNMKFFGVKFVEVSGNLK